MMNQEKEIITIVVNKNLYEEFQTLKPYYNVGILLDKALKEYIAREKKRKRMLKER